MMSVQTGIETKLAQNFNPLHMEVVNESNNHNVPPGSESHFKVVLVSGEFDGKSPVMRHRAVNKVLADELANQIHALALHTYTEQEWQAKNGTAPMSPPCRGGGKA
jgi:BolA protein